MITDLVENIHQTALRKWLEAGLSISEVVALNGDAGYLLNNMIAKYTLAASSYVISVEALEQFRRQGIDLSQRYARRRFYGKRSPFIYEHAIPVGIIRGELLSRPNPSEGVRNVLMQSGHVAVLLREEDQRIRAAGLASRMPSNWSFGDDPLARYQTVGIEMSDQMLKVEGAIFR